MMRSLISSTFIYIFACSLSTNLHVSLIFLCINLKSCILGPFGFVISIATASPLVFVQLRCVHMPLTLDDRHYWVVELAVVHCHFALLLTYLLTIFLVF